MIYTRGHLTKCLGHFVSPVARCGGGPLIRHSIPESSPILRSGLPLPPTDLHRCRVEMCDCAKLGWEMQ